MGLCMVCGKRIGNIYDRISARLEFIPCCGTCREKVLQTLTHTSDSEEDCPEIEETLP